MTSANGPGEPELLPRHAHRALLYIEKLNSAGVRPKPQDVDAFAATDAPRAAQYQSPFAAGLAPMQRFFRGTKVADAEPVTGWLLRMGWLDADAESRLTVSDLGAALLAALRLPPSEWSPEREGAGAVILRPDDPFVYVELTRVISEAGAALLVDPYFKTDMLDWLHNATLVNRLLLSRANKAQAQEVEQISLALFGLRESPGAGRVEIRATISATLHDRCIVPDDGDVLLLGTSITGIGRHLSTIVPLPSPAGVSMRREVEKLWKDAELVQPQEIRRPQDG